MALVRELEDHGCDLKASILCKYTKQEVQRCNACEYKSMTDEERKQIVIHPPLRGAMRKGIVPCAARKRARQRPKPMQKSPTSAWM